MGKTSQRSQLRQNQHVPKIFKKWMSGGEKPEIIFSAITNHLLDNPDCAANYSGYRFSIVARNRNELHTWESIFIKTLKAELFEQKKLVYKTRLFKMLI